VAGAVLEDGFCPRAEAFRRGYGTDKKIQLLKYSINKKIDTLGLGLE
jgi:hypothetical protein